MKINTRNVLAPNDEDETATIYIPSKKVTEKSNKGAKMKELKKTSSENDVRPKSSESSDSGLLEATHVLLNIFTF
jgi:hypothetical protein